MRRRRLGEEIGILSVWLVVFLVMCLLSDRFRMYSNIRILLLNGSVIAFLALGQAFVLLTGGIDLSTGSTVGMTGVLCAVMMQLGLPWPLASLVALGSGVLLGLFNGAVIHYLKIPPFIVTFSTYGVATSVPMIIAEAQSITVADERFAVVGNGEFLTIPMPVVLVTLAALIGYLVLQRTRLGVHIYAVGGNVEAAGLAGVNVALTTISVYAISGFCAGMGGLITTSRLMVGYPSAGTGNELFFSIAAAVVGGVSLFGGVGSVLGAMLGALLIATILERDDLAKCAEFLAAAGHWIDHPFWSHPGHLSPADERGAPGSAGAALEGRKTRWAMIGAMDRYLISNPAREKRQFAKLRGNHRVKRVGRQDG